MITRGTCLLTGMTDKHLWKRYPPTISFAFDDNFWVTYLQPISVSPESPWQWWISSIPQSSISSVSEPEKYLACKTKQNKSHYFLISPMLAATKLSTFWKSTIVHIALLIKRWTLPAYEVWGKVMFSVVYVILSTGGSAFPQCHRWQTPLP